MHESVGLEQTVAAGYDIDVMHVPRRLFDRWVEALEAGQGWAGTEWPLPIYAASGLAHGVVLLNPSADGGMRQETLRRPPSSLTASVHSHLAHI